MKKKLVIIFGAILVFIMIGIIALSLFRSSESYRKAKAAISWDCSVVCAEKSEPDEYVITYSDTKVVSKTGELTVQNRNDFDIIVHLLCDGEQEIVSGVIPIGGSYTLLKVTDKEYTVGVHADVDKNTNIKVFVCDGKDTNPYTK